MTGKLLLPLPELGDGAKVTMKKVASDMQARIRAQTPGELRNSIKVRPFKKGSSTGIEIEYDDRAENYVYRAMEYPRPGDREETIIPKE